MIRQTAIIYVAIVCSVILNRAWPEGDDNNRLRIATDRWWLKAKKIAQGSEMPKAEAECASDDPLILDNQTARRKSGSSRFAATEVQ